jgi:hypothetical protein
MRVPRSGFGIQGFEFKISGFQVFGFGGLCSSGFRFWGFFRLRGLEISGFRF